MWRGLVYIPRLHLGHFSLASVLQSNFVNLYMGSFCGDIIGRILA